MRAELARLHTRLGIPTVYVTHDQTEAMTLGQRVAVMRDGKVQQIDRPQNLYANPDNLFVAAFIGSPAMNLVEAELAENAVSFAECRIIIPPSRRPRLPNERSVILGIRPESFEDAAFASSELPTIDVVADVVEELGAETHVLFTVDAPRVSTSELRAAANGEDDTLLVADRATFVARVNPASRACAGASLRLAIHTDQPHFFDLTSGASLLPQPALAAVPV